MRPYRFEWFFIGSYSFFCVFIDFNPSLWAFINPYSFLRILVSPKGPYR